MRIDYPDLELLHARARRHRAEMVWQLFIAPVIRFFRKDEKPVARTAPLRSRLA